MKKKFLFFVMVFSLMTCVIYAYPENGDGYPHSYETGDSNHGDQHGNGEEGQGSGETNTPTPDGDPHYSDTTGSMLAQATDALNSQVEGEQAAVEGIMTGEEGNTAESAVSSEIAASNKVSEAAASTAAEISDNVKNSQNEGNSSNSLAAGDPVKISKGTYELSETDITIGSRNLFSVKRRYESENPVCGSFGYGWSTNLDERIILGINPLHENEAFALIEYMEKLNALIRITEINLGIQYLVPDIYNASEVLTERINNCDSHIETLDNMLSRIEELKDTAASYFVLLEKLEEIEVKVLNTKTEAENKKQKLEECLEKIGDDLSVLDILKQKMTFAQNEMEKQELKLKEDKERHRKNKNALFDGMSEIYEVTGLNTITVIDAEGYPHILTESNGCWFAENDRQYLRCESNDNQFVLYEKNGTVKRFDENGLLISIKDRNNNLVELLRNSEEKLKCIQTSDDELFEFEYNNNLITKITNKRAQEENVVYRYAGNRLESVKDTEGDIVSMNYDLDGRLTSLNKCDGSSVVFTYGEQKGDGKTLTTVTTNEEGYSEYFEYDLSDNRTDYIDHDGNLYSYFYDENHRTIKEVYPDGKVIQNEYDTAGNLIYQNINGSETLYEYDAAGNMICALYDDGTIERWSYDSFNYVTSYVNRDSVIEEFHRDTNGNLLEYRKGGVAVAFYEYDAKGAVTKQTVYGERPVITEYQHDNYGNLMVENCGSTQKKYLYDNRNRLITYSVNEKIISEYFYKNHEVIRNDYNGLEVRLITNGRKDITKVIQKDTVSGELHELRIEYDKRHLPLKIFISDGENERLLVTLSYSAEGKVISEELHGKENIIKEYVYQNGDVCELKCYKDNSQNEEIFITTYQNKILNKGIKKITEINALGIQNIYEYDKYNNLIKYIDGNGEERDFEYSGCGLLLSEQNSYGGLYEYQYDSASNLRSQKEQYGIPVQMSYYPDDSLKSMTDRYGIVTSYHYDNQGRLICEENISQKIWYQYDAMNRITKKIIGPESNEVTAVYFENYEYSDDGKNITEIKGGKYITSYKLDAFGNVRKIIDGNNNERSFVCNAQNQLIESLDGYGNKTLYEYDAAGNVCKIILPDGSVTNYEYNALGLLKKISDECGVVYQAEYDAAGRLIKEKRRAESEKCYEYDKAGRVVKVLCGSEVVEKYSYSNRGRIVTVVDGNQNNYSYFYDAFGRLEREENRKSYNQSYSYDKEGNLDYKQDFAGNIIRISYSSDRSECIIDYSDGSKNRFVYDAIGNLIEAENECSHTLFIYDKGGFLIKQKELILGEEMNFEYDKSENRTRLNSSTCDTIYTYGKNNELIEIFDNKQRVSIKLAYNKNGREVLRKYGNGTKEESLYDKAGRIIVKMLKSEQNELFWGEGYVYSADGKRIATVDNNARLTLYEYNPRGQLSTVLYPYSDEMLQKQKSEAIENGLSINVEYGENRFLSSSEKEAVIPLLNSMQNGLAYKLTNLQVFIRENYSYDANGNRIAKITPYGKIEYCYDKENCLVSSGSKGQVFVNYTSDKMGNLLSEESATKKFNYSYNVRNRLISCECTDESAKTYAQTSYAYDAFDRRSIVKDFNSLAISTLYDGMGFEVVKQNPVYIKGLFADVPEVGIRWEKSGNPNGDRYRYLSDEDSAEGSRYFYLDEENYKIASTRYYGERTQLYANNTIAAQFTNEYGTDYFSTDSLGSVRVTSDVYGSINSSNTYDAFGSLVQGKLNGRFEYGYLGKSFDPTASLYNYGYRDYNPSASRFTTVDPIRDSTNWFAYCNSDPVNFVDLLGLFFYGSDGQHSITENKQTTVEIIRNDNGLGNSFDSTRYIYKNDGINTKLVYVDTVGANCKASYYNTKQGMTLPDGCYYLTNEGTSYAPLNTQKDGTTNSTSYKNVLSLRTNDSKISDADKNLINQGDNFMHANQKSGKEIYTDNSTPESAGCIIGKNGQKQQDKMMEVLMDGVKKSESILVNIRSFEKVQGCGK